MAIRFVDVEPDEAGSAKPAARRARAPEAAPDRTPEPAAFEASEAFETSRASEASETPQAPEPAGTGAAPGDGAAPPAALPALPHAKPEPKARGRKKPMSAVGADKRADGQGARQGTPDRMDVPSAPLLEGLLPELQAHAKPTPKPRGRKKAFG